MNKIGIAVVAVVMLVALAGCNTMRGAGKDVESAGKGIQKTVDHND